MKSLQESLFDVEKNIEDRSDLERAIFDDINSDFWKCVIPVAKYGSIPNIGDIPRKINTNKKIITIQSNVEVGAENIKNPIIGYDLDVESFYVGQPNGSGPHPHPIPDGLGFKRIYAEHVKIDGFAEVVNGFDFHIKDSLSYVSKAVVTWGECLKKFDVKINFENNERSVLSYINTDDFPNLGGIKTNASSLHIYDPSFFRSDHVINKLDKFFGGGTIYVTDQTGKRITKKRNTRNIMAVVNNLKKYGGIKIEDERVVGKVSDLFDLQGFNNLQIITLCDNNTELIFINTKYTSIKGYAYETLLRHARYLRLNNLKYYKDYGIDSIKYDLLQQQTKDGWVVCIEKRIF